MIAIPKNIEPLPIRTVMEEIISLLRLRRYYETQIESDNFDPELSQRIDCLNFLIDSRGPHGRKDIESSSQIL